MCRYLLRVRLEEPARLPARDGVGRKESETMGRAVSGRGWEGEFIWNGLA